MNVNQLCDAVSVLASFPQVFERARRLLDDPHATKEDLLEVVAHDPTTLARLMAMANKIHRRSGGTRGIEDPNEAARLIDIGHIRTILTTGTAIDAFEHVGEDLVDMQNFWQHSICSALAADYLASACGQDRQHLYMAGLLHDIGQLIIYQAEPERAREVLAHAGESYRYRAEKEVLGITHAEVGAELIRRMNLSESLQEAIRFHHEPALTKRAPMAASIVHLATAIANCVEPSWKMDIARHDPLASINPFAWEATGLTPAIIEPTLLEINLRSFEVISIIEPDAFLVY
jgi:putative nucleotidyltransferase with HDIG domain